MEMTNFQKIIEFHTSFGLPYCEKINLENLHNFQIVSLRVKLIDEEYHEYLTSINSVQKLDAIGDLLYVVYGAGASCGFNLDQLFDEYCYNVCKQYKLSWQSTNVSNFKKSCILHKMLNVKYDLGNSDVLNDEKNILNYSYIFSDLLRDLSHNLLICKTQRVSDILVAMLFSLYEFGYLCKIDLDKLFAEIHSSNMSKLCKTEQEAIDSVEMYKKTYLIRYPKPTYSLTPDKTKYVIFDDSTGKRLKSINFVEPKINVEELKMLTY